MPRFLPVLLTLFSAASCAVVPSPHAVEESGKMLLGGVEQSVLVRGEDLENPVLLFLHGGPGIPEMPVYWRNTGLEKDFTVVQWDQRGAGKSFDPDLPATEITVEKIVEDCLELTRQIRSRSGGRKIYLVGFSFGSLVGALAVAEEPEHFAAYVGISQFVNIPRSERRLYSESVARALRQNDLRALNRIREIGNYPYAGQEIEAEVNRLQTRLVAKEIDRGYGMPEYLWDTAVSPFYRPFDIVRLARGYKRTLLALEDRLYGIDLARRVPAFDIPVFFFAPRQDTVLSQSVAEEYYGSLSSPSGKYFRWFERTSHPLHLERPEAFQAAMRSVREQTSGG